MTYDQRTEAERARWASSDDTDLFVPSPRVAAKDDDDDVDETLGAMDNAEYIIFLLGFDTYLRYIQEFTEPLNEDQLKEPETAKYISALEGLAAKGVKLMIQVDREVTDSFKQFVLDRLEKASHKTMFLRVMRVRPTSAQGIAMRAQMVRDLMDLAQLREAVFGKSRKAATWVRQSVMATWEDDADKALDVFEAFNLSNARVRSWFDIAAKLAGSHEVPDSAIAAGVLEASGKAQDLFRAQIEETGAEDPAVSRQGTQRKQEVLAQVEQKAAEAAKKVMNARGEDDTPPTRSEAIGIAMAAATAVAADPANPAAVPQSLRDALGKDEEQLAAAMTEGRVIVAAGAGAGKSRTLVARVVHLIKDRPDVAANNILIASFNRDAADELASRLREKLGEEDFKILESSIGTTHSLFARWLMDKSINTSHPALMRAVTEGNIQGGDSLMRQVNEIWRRCKSTIITDESGRRKVLKAQPPSNAAKLKTYWAGNGISVEEAKATACCEEEYQAAEWYEMYEGMKGAIPGWRLQCDPASAGDPDLRRERIEANEIYQKHEREVRRGGRLSDFDDHLSMCATMLAENPQARKALQRRFKHVLVDECQDMSATQLRVFDMITEHVTPKGENGTSFWMVGDEKQSIYAWRGAKREVFRARADDEGWQLRTISTNYRCPPRLVEFANGLIAHNDDQIPFVAKPSPYRQATEGSMRVETPDDEKAASVLVAATIQQRLKEDAVEGRRLPYAEHAVLSRTQAMLDVYETACVFAGLPYARKGPRSSFGTPEMKAAVGAIKIAFADDAEASHRGLADLLGSPRKLSKAASKDLGKKVETALKQTYGREWRETHIRDAINDPRFQSVLARELGNNPGTREVVQLVVEDINKLLDIRVDDDGSPPPMDRVMDTILTFRGKVTKQVNGQWVSEIQEWKDIFLQAEADKQSGDDDDDIAGMNEEEAAAARKKKGYGSLGFLTLLMAPDPDNDEADETDPPNQPSGFLRKVARVAESAKKLSYDVSLYRRAVRGIAAYRDRKVTEWVQGQKVERVITAKEQLDADLARLPYDQVPGDKMPTPQEILENPDLLKRPPAVYLGTIHSTKGAEWRSTYVLMPEGKFPTKLQLPKDLVFPDTFPEDRFTQLDAAVKEGRISEDLARDLKAGVTGLIKDDPEVAFAAGVISLYIYEQWRDHLRNERRLAYVAVTRAKERAMMVCPAEVDGKPGGPSPFIREMGLQQGENIGRSPADDDVDDEIRREVGPSEATPIRPEDGALQPTYSEAQLLEAERNPSKVSDTALLDAALARKVEDFAGYDSPEVVEAGHAEIRALVSRARELEPGWQSFNKVLLRSSLEVITNLMKAAQDEGDQDFNVALNDLLGALTELTFNARTARQRDSSTALERLAAAFDLDWETDYVG